MVYLSVERMDKLYVVHVILSLVHEIPILSFAVEVQFHGGE